MTATRFRTFAGANIKGFPAMSATKVRRDLEVIKARAHVFGLQEFKLPWYWGVLVSLLSALKWGTWPARTEAREHPVTGGQAVVWRRRRFRCVGRRKAVLMWGQPGISETRWLRAVLLKDRATGLAAWYGSTHFVVGGDNASDSERRKGILRDNLRNLDAFLADLVSTGHPVVMELDANIHRHTWAYADLMGILRKYHATVHGDHGVEFLFTIPGTEVVVQVARASIIPTSALNTDHEVRLIVHRLATKGTPHADPSNVPGRL